MSIVRKGKAEMTYVVGAVFGFGHGAQRYFLERSCLRLAIGIGEQLIDNHG